MASIFGKLTVSLVMTYQPEPSSSLGRIVAEKSNKFIEDQIEAKLIDLQPDDFRLALRLIDEVYDLARRQGLI